MQREDRLLEGAFDTHAHGHPEFTLGMGPRVDNIEWAKLASAAGMRGFIVKSHVFPTTNVANMLRILQPDLDIFGGITLNPPVGGLSPLSVELAAQTGGRIVWMPTWSALQSPPKPSIFRERMKPWITTLETDPDSVPDLGILGTDGGLLPEVVRIIELCKQYDTVLATGHLPIEASLILAEETEAQKVRLLLTHPLSGSVGASTEQQRTIVAHGGTIEHVFIGSMPMHQRMDPQRIVDAVEAVGAEHCVMGSDAIEAWNPPAPEVLRMFIGTMLAIGVSEGAVHAMTHENPERLFRLDARPISPSTQEAAQ
ncbi:hypothetical protein AX769_07400 [Frondihabitans sp. PAMC 28766]|uniref:DUF6282 family protein n=1 Tax=Frondihabitans sp. PAMC 28766 TaxID=1795630 RepID=UPI00078D729E|nr:DUF6282 family protein [Frondihabitans sp. PAMC 28766]AMM20022.1 hypothetical protein AX769_07400 [Frondihabitans sp. PAMC 28766]